MHPVFALLRIGRPPLPKWTLVLQLDESWQFHTRDCIRVVGFIMSQNVPIVDIPWSGSQ